MTGILQALLSFFGASSSSGATYIEDVFSTYLYTGTGSALTITNGIDLAGKGGLLTTKSRAVNPMEWISNVTGLDKSLESNSSTDGVSVSTFNFNSNGYTINTTNARWNQSATNYVSWTFRKQEKFFDVLTYTGTGANRTVSHNLGSVPGCIIVKRTDATAGDWQVYHRSLANTEYIVLNTGAAKATGATRWNSTTATSTVFSLGTDATVNASGGTYVAYLFAHDAGGFGAAGTDNVISCGSYTGTGTSGNAITLGYEPQWILIKNASASADWILYDTMRGLPIGTGDRYLRPNATTAEADSSAVDLSANGFSITATSANWNTNGSTYVYVAIRRGPMKTPTSATTVFGLNARTGTGVNTTVTGGAGVTDLALIKSRTSANEGFWVPRLTANNYLIPSSSSNETTATTLILQTNPWDVMDGVKVGTTGNASNDTGNTYINYLFDRAPGFMDVVCYTGTGSPTTVTHNLGVVPELIITKRRDSNYDWVVYSQTLGTTKVLFLNANDAETTFTGFGNVTSTNFDAVSVVQNGNQVAYLFATLSGISKVGSYTGTGTTQVINCGFTAGSRFVMIKRTDSIGDWYYWDSARGIVAGNDPYLLMNSAAAEVTSTDYIDTANSGFEISSTAPAAINANGGTFIFYAIA
jgi:hypothetical protein